MHMSTGTEVFPAFGPFTSLHSRRVVSILTCNGIEKHEVLEIRDLPPLPALGHVGGLEELSRSGQRNSSAMEIIKVTQSNSGQTAQQQMPRSFIYFYLFRS